MVATVRRKQWTPEEYERLGELGVFGPEKHVQLVDGVIYEIGRQTPQHANTIPEYWIDNIIDQQLEVHRDPSPSGYQTRFVLKRGDSVSPLAKPDASIPVADLLP
jgi:Uma2 family endonuclease